MATKHTSNQEVYGDLNVIGGYYKQNGSIITFGTVTSVALTVPSFLSITGSPITTSGTLAVSLVTQSANTVLAGPTSGGASTPAFRGLVAADIPGFDASKITGGTLPMSRGGTNNATWGGTQNLVWYDDISNSLNQWSPSSSLLGTGSGSPGTWVWRSVGTSNFPMKVSCTGWSATTASTRNPSTGMTLAQIIDVVKTLVADLKDVGVLSA